MRNIAATAFGSVTIELPYGMVLTRVFKPFIPIEDQNSLKSTLFDELTLWRMVDEAITLSEAEWTLDEVQEKLDRDDLASELYGEQITSQAIWGRLGSMYANLLDISRCLTILSIDFFDDMLVQVTTLLSYPSLLHMLSMRLKSSNTFWIEWMSLDNLFFGLNVFGDENHFSLNMIYECF